MATIVTEYLDFPTATGTVTIEPIQPVTVCHVTLTGNVTLATADLDDGELITLTLEQDATGGHTVTFPTEFKFPGGVAPTLTTTANAVDVLSFIIEGGRVLLRSVQLDLK